MVLGFLLEFLCLPRLLVQLRERSPAVGLEDSLLLGDVTVGERTDLCTNAQGYVLL